jgi:hypothetical protein
MRQRGVKYLADSQDRAAAAEQILLLRIGGASIRELMAEFRCSRATVFRRLAEGRRGGTAERARQIVFQRLLVKALAAYDVALEGGSETAARDVLLGSGVLGSSTESRTGLNCEPQGLVLEVKG